MMIELRKDDVITRNGHYYTVCRVRKGRTFDEPQYKLRSPLGVVLSRWWVVEELREYEIAENLAIL